MSKKREIVILGGGISGLATAYFLKKYSEGRCKITLLEKSARVGGWIESREEEGFLLELGPRGFQGGTKGKITLKLVEDLGLKESLLEANPRSKKRYLYLKNSLTPLSWKLLLKQGFLSACFRDWRMAPANEDESIGSLFERRFNKKIVEKIIDPVVRGIYGGDPYKLSFRSSFPSLFAWEQHYGSLTKGFLFSPKTPTPLYSFKKGMELLPKTLKTHLQEEICLEEEVVALSHEERRVRVVTAKRVLYADHLITTLPSSALPQFHLPLPFLSLTVVNLGFHTPVLTKKGYGYLVPSSANERILGMTWDSEIFPEQQQGGTLLTLMLPGEVAKKEALEIAQEALQKHLQIEKKPDLVHTKIAHNAIPQYPVGHKERWGQIHCPNMTLLGTSFRGVSVNDCIFHAEQTARTLQ